MKAIVKYEANDGSEFDDPGKCSEYEGFCQEIINLTAAWPETPINGDGFVQQDKIIVLQVQRAMIDFFERIHWKDHHTEWAKAANVPVGLTLIGRYVDDAGTNPERRIWRRIARLDKKFREYEQPYYAIQADKYD